MQNDSMAKTLTVAILLCLVCSVIVSGAAVFLKPAQERNKLLDKQKNILSAAGMLDEGENIAAQFKKVEKRVVDIETGQYVTEKVNVKTYDQRQARNDPELNERIPAEEDIAGLKRRAEYAEVYLVRNEEGDLQTLILPISGYGLWSTLYGFIALEDDLNTVAGLAFYDHGETPGLGGEVDNPRWKAQWPGKEIYNDKGEVAAKLKKGGVDPSVPYQKEHFVDGLSGATLTSNGVNNLLQYWLGPKGFLPFLENLALRQPVEEVAPEVMDDSDSKTEAL